MDPMHRQHRRASTIGALIALAVFLFSGLHLAIYFGDYAGRLLAEGIVGGPTPGPVTTFLRLFGSGIGISAVASLFAVAGGTIGAGVGVLLSRLKKTPAAS